MGLKELYKKIRYRLSRDYCYEKMKRSGHAFLNCCGGQMGGDKYTEYLSYDCVDCPYYMPGFSVERYRKDLLEKRKEHEFMTKHITEPVKCPYCQEGHALVEGKTNDAGIAILYPNRLLAYGYDIHGPGSNGLSVKINYCPMCGKKL